ncbi:MAG: squalene/phytoene synthase family protein [Marinovum sp.]|nr:squalene/phytoene synthase family protein [Marinovum sp.]
MAADVPDWIASAGIVERGDPTRFAATMAAPLEVRAALFPLYAMAVEVARAPWVTQEAMIGEMRLQWWRDALEEIAEGVEVRRHEVTTALAARLTVDQAKRLDETVAARRWDLYRDPFEDIGHFERYIDQTTGHVMATGVELLGGHDTSELRNLTFAAGVAGFLKAVPELEAQWRVPLLDGRPDAISQLAQDALTKLRSFKRESVARAAWPALMPAFEARSVLQQAARDPQAVSGGCLGPTGLSRPWALLRARSGRF